MTWALREFRDDGADRVDAIQAGDSHVHQGNVGLVLFKRLHCLPAVAGFGDGDHILLAVDDRFQPFADHEMILDDHDADLR